MTRHKETGAGMRQLRKLIYTRAGKACDRCGHGIVPSEFQLHHRQLRSQQGDDTPANCIVLCWECHGWVHNHVAAARAQGFLVSAYSDPATTPIKRPSGAYALPNLGGDKWVPQPA